MSALRPLARSAVLPALARRLTAAAAAPPPPPAVTAAVTPTPDAAATPPPTRAPADRALGTVRDVLRTKGEKFYHTTADARVAEAAREMARHDIGSLIIVDPGPSRRPVGIVTETDFLQKVVARSGAAARDAATGGPLRVRDIMSDKPLAVVSPDATLSDCMELMAERRIRHVPVVEGTGRRVLGMVSVGDIVKELVAAHSRNAEHLQSFITGSY